MAKVTVTGGTGVLGRALVPRLQADGHQVTVLTRRPAARVPDGASRVIGDLARADGLDPAVAEAEAVVHLASQPFRPARVDVAGTRALIEAVRRSGGGPHLVHVTIVGVDKIPWPYYERKPEAEAVVSASGLSFTIQRATQFHDLMLMAMASAARAPVLIVPSGTSCQPVDAGDVAERRVAAGFRAGRHLAASTPRGARTWGAYMDGCCRAEPGVLWVPYTGRRIPIPRRDSARRPA
jgi:uncharacterized protein YbjT (DUF2867 family)